MTLPAVVPVGIGSGVMPTTVTGRCSLDHRAKVRFRTGQGRTFGRLSAEAPLCSLVRVDLLQRLADRIGNGVNVALAAAFAVVIGLDTRQVAAAGGRWPCTLGAGLVICALALFRRHGRARAAVCGLAVFGASALVAGVAGWPAPSFTSGALAGLLVLGASAIRGLPVRPATIIALAGAAIVAATEVSRAADTQDARMLFGLAGIVIWVAALSLGGWLRYLDRQREAAIDTARRDERLELARELHDVVAHHVTGIVVQAQAAGYLGQAHPDASTSALSSIETAGLEALASMRRLVALLRAPDEPGGNPAQPEPLTDLVRRFAGHGPAVDLRAPADIPDPNWPPEVGTTLYRIVQEALTNIARHAPDARTVTVSIAPERGRVTVEIVNDALVPATTLAARRSSPGGGYGLVGMRERVEALGGDFRAGPLPHTGWSVRASLPVNLPAAS